VGIVGQCVGGEYHHVRADPARIMQPAREGI
jgi:hypothetical protein